MTNNTLTGFRKVLSELLAASGVAVLACDGNLFLRCPDEDAYELRVKRADDADEHFMPIRFRAQPRYGLVSDGPLSDLQAHRIAARARRWLRLPPPPPPPLSPEAVELFNAEMEAASKRCERAFDALLWGPRRG